VLDRSHLKKYWSLVLLLLRFLFRIWKYTFRAAVLISKIHPGLIVVPVVFFLGVKLYWHNYASVSWRQELRFEVATPSGIAHGSSIVKPSVWFKPYIMHLGGRFSSIVGQAVVVNLGEGKWLFALLDNQIYMVDKALPSAENDKRGRGYNRVRLLRKQKEPLPIKFSDLPPLVTFSDINDPESMLIVDPDDLASVFGDGYALKSVTLTPVTDGQLVNVWPCLAAVDPCLPWTFSNQKLSPLWHRSGAWFYRSER
jgi:hypothetical protein